MALPSHDNRDTARTIRVLRAAFYTMLGFLVLVLGLVFLWFAIPTSSVLNVISYRFDRETMTFEMQRRVSIAPYVRAVWATEVTGGGLDCSETGVTTYERYIEDEQVNPVLGPDGDPIERITTRFKPGDALLPCLADPNATIVARWSVHVFGTVFLRPMIRYIPARE